VAREEPIRLSLRAGMDREEREGPAAAFAQLSAHDTNVRRSRLRPCLFILQSGITCALTPRARTRLIFSAARRPDTCQLAGGKGRIRNAEP